MFFQSREPSEGGIISLFGDIKAGEDELVFSIHKCHQTAVLMEVGAIQNQIPEETEIFGLRRWLLKPVVFDPFEFWAAVTREIGQLPDCVMLSNPELEPRPLNVFFVFIILPDECFWTDGTSKSLLCVNTSAVSLYETRAAVKAVLFFSLRVSFIKLVWYSDLLVFILLDTIMSYKIATNNKPTICDHYTRNDEASRDTKYEIRDTELGVRNCLPPKIDGVAKPIL